MNNTDTCSSYNGAVTKIVSDYLRIYQLDSLPIYLFLTLAHKDIFIRTGDTVQCQELYVQSILDLGIILTYCPGHSVVNVTKKLDDNINPASQALDADCIRRFICHPTDLIFFTKFILKLSHKFQKLFPLELLLGIFSCCLKEVSLYVLLGSVEASCIEFASLVHDSKLSDTRLLSTIIRSIKSNTCMSLLDSIENCLFLVSDLMKNSVNNSNFSAVLTINELADYILGVPMSNHQLGLFGILSASNDGTLLFQDSTGSIPLILDYYDPRDLRYIKNGLCFLKDFVVIYHNGKGILFCRRENLSCFARKTTNTRDNSKRIILDTFLKEKNGNITLNGVKLINEKVQSITISIESLLFIPFRLFILPGYVYDFYNCKSLIHVDDQGLDSHSLEILMHHRQNIVKTFRSVGETLDIMKRFLRSKFYQSFDLDFSCFGRISKMKKRGFIELVIEDIEAKSHKSKELTIIVQNDNLYYDMISLLCDYYVVFMKDFTIDVWLKRLKIMNFDCKTTLNNLSATSETLICTHMSCVHCPSNISLFNTKSFESDQKCSSSNMKPSRGYFFEIYKSQPDDPIRFYICQITSVHELVHKVESMKDRYPLDILNSEYSFVKSLLEKENSFNLNSALIDTFDWELETEAQDGTGVVRLVFRSLEHIRMVLSWTDMQYKKLMERYKDQLNHTNVIRIQFITKRDHLLSNMKQSEFWKVVCEHAEGYHRDNTEVNSNNDGSFDNVDNNILVKPVNIDKIKFLTNSWKTRTLIVTRLERCTLADVCEN